MKKITYVFLFLILLIVGCKKEDDEPTNPGTGTVGGTVTFQAQAVKENEQYFVRFKPDKNMVLTRIIISLQGQGTDTVSGDNSTIFNPQGGFKIGPSPIPITIGQVWAFVIQGKIGNAQGQQFTSAVTLTVTSIEGETGGGGDVTIEVQGQQLEDGYYFYLKPSVGINLVSVTARVPAANYEQTIQIGENFNTTGFQGYLKYETGSVQSGQQWSFTFQGTKTDGGGQFTATANYTIP